MEIELFKFIDEAAELYKDKLSTFKYVDDKLYMVFNNIFNTQNDSVVNVRTRIKNEASFREKLIRNKFYANYSSAKEALDAMPDIIGVTMQCRFIRNEAELYKYLFYLFEERDNKYICKADPHIYLDLRMPQPQLQRNGFTIYRIDGYYLLGDEKVNFELQIKSLVHAFWSEIEHEVVYKNPDFLIYDQYNINMLKAIRDNLDIVDRQLELMYQEISNESKHYQINFEGEGFNAFLARAINDLINRKCKKSLGFTTDFKKLSSCISRFVYINEFLNEHNNYHTTVSYLEKMSELSETDIDFKEVIKIDNNVETLDPFIDKLVNYFITRLNEEFQLHLFFLTLFHLKNDDKLSVLIEFAGFYKNFITQPSRYKTFFMSFEGEERINVINEIENQLVDALIEINSVSMLYEEKMIDIEEKYEDLLTQIDIECDTYEKYEEVKESYFSSFKHYLERLLR